MRASLLVLFSLFCLVSEYLAAKVSSSGQFKQLSSSLRISLAELGAKTATQDKLGFIWMAGEFGLVRYDGKNLLAYHDDPLDPAYDCGRGVDHFLKDTQENLWVSTVKSVCVYNFHQDRFIPVLSSETGSQLGAYFFSIALDSKGRLYAAKDHGFSTLDIKSGEINHYPVSTGSKHSDLVTGIQDLFVDRHDRLWLGTRKNGLLHFDMENKTVKQFKYDKDDTQSISSNDVEALAQDASGILWITTQGGGVNAFDTTTEKFTRYRHDPKDSSSIGSNTAWNVFVDSFDTVWFATDPGGLARYNRATNTFTRFQPQPFNSNSLSSSRTFSIFEDRNNDLWIGSYPNGFDILVRSSLYIQNYHHDSKSDNTLNDSSVSSIAEDTEGTIWIGTEKGINAFNLQSGVFTDHAVTPSHSDDELGYKPVISLEQSQDQILWVGSWGSGLYRYDTSAQIYTKNIADKKGNNILSDKAIIWDISETQSGRIWIATESDGAYIYDPVSRDYEHYGKGLMEQYRLSSDAIWSIFEDSRKRIWFATGHGLDMLDNDKQTIQRFSHSNTSFKRFNSINFRSFAEDKYGNIWIGSADKGIFVFDNQKHTINKLKTEKIKSTFISGLVNDALGFIWVTTPKGIYKINIETHETEAVGNNTGFINTSFDRNVVLRTHRGDLLFGASNGFSIFSPKALGSTSTNFNVEITNFSLSFRPVEVHSTGVLTTPIFLTDKITLPHYENIFAFNFSALNYLSLETNYYYRLIGFNNNWIDSGQSGIASYTNLKAGEYRFEVKAINSKGEWSANTKAIDITLLPAPWKTWWAYICYAMILAGLIFWFFYTLTSRIRLTEKHILNEQLIRLDKIKDAFLASTSHELRTPLNGIIGLTDALRHGPLKAASDEIRHNLSMISSTGKRLSYLINDILDYSKLRDNSLKLHYRSINLHAITENAIALLHTLAQNKPVVIINDIAPDLPRVFADENRLSQIMINLIGNAIKYTDEGKITIKAREKDYKIHISVADTGVGIPEHRLSAIFEAFSQIEGNDSKVREGTGLGLAITRQLVELHGGSIQVESTVGTGSCFSFSINASSSQSNSVDRERQGNTQAQQVLKQTISTTSPDTLHEKTLGSTSNLDDEILSSKLIENPDSSTILIVDDDPVNRLILQGILKLHHYTIIEASHGQEALDILADNSVDLVLLDVMMPHMSGFDTCAEIRKTWSITELPIFFLSARTVDSDFTQGFQVGGNDFLTKPVAKEVLLPKIATQLLIQRTIETGKRNTAQVQNTPPARH